MIRLTVTTLDQLKLAPATRPAAGSASAMPAPVARAARYTSAVTRWIAAGRPTRSQEQIDELLATCQSCDLFNPKAGACRKCGCNINNQANGLRNKLAMATEHCPLEKW